MNSILKTVDGNIEKMTTLDHTVPKIIGLVNDLNSSTQDLIKVIQMDPVLTGKVLKLVNSSFFGLPTQITSLSRAVILLGLNTIKHLALTSCVLGSLQKGLRSKHLSSEQFWTYSVGTAVFSQILGRELKLDKQVIDDLFLVGLLHCIGIAFLMQFYPSEYEQVLALAKEREVPLTEVESDMMGISHLEVGERLAMRWRLPDWLVDGVKNYPNPLNSELKTTLVVAVASNLLRINKVGSCGEGYTEYLAPEIWDVVGTTQTRAQELLEARLRVELAKASQFVRGA
jgi:HD-like signal output (HDOD) protein